MAVSLSVNNVALMYSPLLNWIGNIGGALVRIKPLQHPAGSNPGDNDVALELHLGGPLNMWKLAVAGPIDHICLQYAVATMVAPAEQVVITEAPEVIISNILIRGVDQSLIRMQWPFIRTRSWAANDIVNLPFLVRTLMLFRSTIYHHFG